MAQLTSLFFRIISVFLTLLYVAEILLAGVQRLTRKEAPLQGVVTVTAHSGCIG